METATRCPGRSAGDMTRPWEPCDLYHRENWFIRLLSPAQTHTSEGGEMSIVESQEKDLYDPQLPPMIGTLVAS